MDKYFQIDGKKFADARRAAGHVQETLAPLIDRTVRAVAGMEGAGVHQVYWSLKPRLAAALRIPEDELLSRLAPDAPDVQLPPLGRSAATPRATWLRDQLVRRGIQPADFAKLAGISPAALDAILRAAAPLLSESAKRVTRALAKWDEQYLLSMPEGEDAAETKSEDSKGDGAQKKVG